MAMGVCRRSAIFNKATKLDPNNASLIPTMRMPSECIRAQAGWQTGDVDSKSFKLDPHNVKRSCCQGRSRTTERFCACRESGEDAHAYLPPDDRESADRLKASIAEAKRHLGGPSKNMLMRIRRWNRPSPSSRRRNPGSRAITGKVVLGPNLASKTSLPDTLFVFAKDVAGPPMPVSIVRASKGSALHLPAG